MPLPYLQDLKAFKGRLDHVPHLTTALLGPLLDQASFCLQC